MLNPREECDFLKTITNIEGIANETLFEKYLIQNKRGEKKLEEIESTDQEIKLISLNGGYPMPGMIYTFMYGEPDQIQAKLFTKDFIDVAPILFCMNSDRGSFKGINMNMLPPDARLDFLESFYLTFKDFYEREAEVLSQNDKLAINKRFLSYAKSGKTQEMLRVFNSKNAANFNYGYRSYKIEKVKKLRMIEFNEWLYIPFFVPKNAFRKMNFVQIHKLYK